jgi:uncharacterized cupin superfamily protein
MDEAQSVDTPFGRYVSSAGWFVLNLADTYAVRNDERGGAIYALEPPAARFGGLGINARYLLPGQAISLYHAEDTQEDFLVMAGECTVVIEEQERTLRAWDFLHCPPGTKHALIGAGDGPCLLIAVGARLGPDAGPQGLVFPVSPAAARHGLSVAEETGDMDTANADWPGSWEPVRLPWPLA